MKLRERQKRFADLFLELGNAEQAAIKAGYSEKYARGNAHKLVANSCIKKHIDERLNSKNKERIASQDEVLEFLTNVMRGKVTEKVPLGLGMGEQMLVKNELQGKDRIKAAELIGKRYGLWVEKVNLDGDLAVTIIDDIGVDDEED
ncbi:terminase small subunit [Brevibacillus halotolerans]|nr:terminase small subunit [Brevibacillus halotolerans]